MDKKELYISSDEYDSLKEVRKVLDYEFMQIGEKDFLRVEIDKCLIGQSYGWGRQDIYELFLSCRHHGYTVNDFEGYPLCVYVCIRKIPNLPINSLNDLSHILWAELYDNKSDAENQRFEGGVRYINPLGI